MGQHTPGPWEAHVTEDRIEIRMGSRANGGNPYQPQHEFGVCELFDLDDDQADEAISNVRLIATAPDLLEALKSLLVATEFAMTTPSCPEKGTVVPAEMSKEEYEQKRAVKAARAAIAKATGDTP